MKKIVLLSLFVFALALAWCNQTKTSVTEWNKNATEKQVNKNTTTGSNASNTQISNNKDIKQSKVGKDTQEVLNVIDGLLK